MPFSISSIHSTQGDIASAAAKRIAKVALGLAVVLVVERAKVQAHQRHAPFAGDRTRRQALSPALHAEQHDTFWPIDIRALGSRNGLRRSDIQCFSRARPPTSSNLTLLSSYASDAAPPSASYLVASTRPHIVLADRAIVTQRLAHQPAHVVLFHAEQMHDQHLERVLVAARPSHRSDSRSVSPPR